MKESQPTGLFLQTLVAVAAVSGSTLSVASGGSLFPLVVSGPPWVALRVARRGTRDSRLSSIFTTRAPRGGGPGAALKALAEDEDSPPRLAEEELDWRCVVADAAAGE